MLEIRQLSQNLEEDVIGEVDAEEDVKKGLEEEIRTEKILGNRYLTKIEDYEAGSTIERINQKNQAEVMMK